MARFTIVREERAFAGDIWRICSSETIDTGATRYSVVMEHENVHRAWRDGNVPNRRIVVHEWDR